MGKVSRSDIGEINGVTIILFSFTPLEKRELFLGTLLFVLVELSLVISPFDFFALILSGFSANPQAFSTISFLIILLIFSIPLFLFHELAHKFVSQSYGFVSEFRLFPNLALFSLISIFLPLKIIAPGAVVYRGRYDIEGDARISLAGPLTNILLGGIFLSLSTIFSTEWYLIALYISKFSFDLALFNLLPFFILDGSKVLKWHKGVFGVIFGISALLWLFHPLGIL